MGSGSGSEEQEQNVYPFKLYARESNKFLHRSSQVLLLRWKNPYPKCLPRKAAPGMFYAYQGVGLTTEFGLFICL